MWSSSSSIKNNETDWSIVQSFPKIYCKHTLEQLIVVPSEIEPSDFR